MIWLAGIPIPDSQVIDLALLLRRHDFAYTADTDVAAAQYVRRGTSRTAP